MFFMLSRPYIAALWSPAGKGLTSWLLFVMFNCVYVTLWQRVNHKLFLHLVTLFTPCKKALKILTAEANVCFPSKLAIFRVTGEMQIVFCLHNT